MIKLSKKNSIVFLIAYYVFSIILYVVSETVGSSGKHKYLIILFSCIASLLFSDKSRHRELLALAFIFTLISDTFLVLLYHIDGNTVFQLLGTVTFLIVQLIYATYLYLNCPSQKIKRLWLLVRIVCSVSGAIITFVVLKDKVQALAVIAVVYIINIVINAVLSFIDVKTHSPLMGIAFVCFILCDILVGLNVANGVFLDFQEGSFIYRLININFDISWAFYAVSQIILASLPCIYSIKK